ncbi:ABC transporter permease [Caldisalinibacter kiritimatiensis]|uniref:Binding-protein-dependent transport systems inner membrane component n=1 Tax=Caldisalinibacter kiritimatiensis TaxID=1304284 RepID=R1ATE6_9FIRM|nr:ABC transporter permease [Caldisalinibacter kiritimatiensis]EOC99901.1 binding-protein-dependent transport systems inner membrane component [Caldisalinibacter kiritimatiensis]
MILKDKRIQMVSLVIILAIWQLLSYIYPPIIIPSLTEVFKIMISYITDNTFILDLSLTIFRGISAYFIAMILGIGIGIILYSNKVLNKIFYPYVVVFQSVPRISWILLAMMWFSLNSQIVIFIIIITILPIIILNTLEGLNNIDNELMEMAAVFKIRRKKVIKDIYLPSVVPYILAGAKVALGITWKTVIMAELLTVQTGIGARMSYARDSLATDHILALTVYIVLIGYLFQFILTRVSNYVGRWKKNEGNTVKKYN